MTFWRENTVSPRRWLVLPVTLGTFGLMALWHSAPSWCGPPRAIAQTADAAPFEEIPGEPDVAIGEAPDQPPDHLPAEARRRHVGANAVWMQESNVPPPVPAASVTAPVAVPPPAPVDEATAERVRGLLEQYDRVQQALPQNLPPAGMPDNLAGPPRMDSGDPDPDRLQAPPAHSAPLPQGAGLSDQAAAPAATDPAANAQ
jgi:hypothetical protein